MSENITFSNIIAIPTEYIRLKWEKGDIVYIIKKPIEFYETCGHRHNYTLKTPFYVRGGFKLSITEFGKKHLEYFNKNDSTALRKIYDEEYERTKQFEPVIAEANYPTFRVWYISKLGATLERKVGIMFFQKLNDNEYKLIRFPETNDFDIIYYITNGAHSRAHSAHIYNVYNADIISRNRTDCRIDSIESAIIKFKPNSIVYYIKNTAPYSNPQDYYHVRKVYLKENEVTEDLVEVFTSLEDAQHFLSSLSQPVDVI